jgi:hypothetical protein
MEKHDFWVSAHRKFINAWFVKVADDVNEKMKTQTTQN